MATQGYVLTSNPQPSGAYAPQYGGFYAYEKAILFNNVKKDTYHGFALITGGDLVAGALSGWTFNAGRVISANITSEANPSASILEIDCGAAHSMTNGDLVVITKANNAGHDKPTRITSTGANTFTCNDIAYVAGAGASNAQVVLPAFLQAGAAAAGVYHAMFVIDGTAGTASEDWKWELNTNLLPNDNIVSERLSTATLASMSSSGHITIAVNDKVWLSGKNITHDTHDYTVKNMNLYVHRLT